jgi:hypothetical protein
MRARLEYRITDEGRHKGHIAGASGTLTHVEQEDSPDGGMSIYKTTILADRIHCLDCGSLIWQAKVARKDNIVPRVGG